jgi:hypothetical protein
MRLDSYYKVVRNVELQVLLSAQACVALIGVLDVFFVQSCCRAFRLSNPTKVGIAETEMDEGEPAAVTARDSETD